MTAPPPNPSPSPPPPPSPPPLQLALRPPLGRQVPAPHRRHRQRTLVGRAHQSHPCGAGTCRSEEHTSELQSQSNLVCRLLLEKKKKPIHGLLRLLNPSESVQ